MNSKGCGSSPRHVQQSCYQLYSIASKCYIHVAKYRGLVQIRFKSRKRPFKALVLAMAIGKMRKPATMKMCSTYMVDYVLIPTPV